MRKWIKQITGLNWDKFLHLMTGFAIMSVAAIANIMWPQNGLILEYGLAVAWGIGIFKEIIWDSAMKKGTPEMWDAIATIVGSTIMYVIFKMIFKWHHHGRSFFIVFTIFVLAAILIRLISGKIIRKLIKRM